MNVSAPERSSGRTTSAAGPDGVATSRATTVRGPAPTVAAVSVSPGRSPSEPRSRADPSHSCRTVSPRAVRAKRVRPWRGSSSSSGASGPSGSQTIAIA